MMLCWLQVYIQVNIYIYTIYTYIHFLKDSFSVPCEHWGAYVFLNYGSQGICPVVRLLGHEKAMAPHSSTLARKIPWTEEPGGLQSVGHLRVRYN